MCVVNGNVSEVLRWISVAHTSRRRAQHHTARTCPVNQGHFNLDQMQTDAPFLTVARYVERNALRAKLVSRTEDWQWPSLWRGDQ